MKKVKKKSLCDVKKTGLSKNIVGIAQKKNSSLVCYSENSKNFDLAEHNISDNKNKSSQYKRPSIRLTLDKRKSSDLRFEKLLERIKLVEVNQNLEEVKIDTAYNVVHVNFLSQQKESKTHDGFNFRKNMSFFYKPEDEGKDLKKIQGNIIAFGSLRAIIKQNSELKT